MKTKMKKLFGILLTLALVLGLMPGMSNTAYATYDPDGLDHFIPLLDNEGSIASYDVSVRVNDTNPNIERTVRLLFSTFTLSEIRAKDGWSNITDAQTVSNCYLSGDLNPPPQGTQISVSDVGMDTQDKTYTTPSQAGINTLNFEFNAVSLDTNTSYYVYFILRTAKGPDHTIYRIIGDKFGPLKPMTINYYKQNSDGNSYTSKVIHTHYISGKSLDVSKLGTVPTGYHLNTSKSTNSGNWDGSSAINIYYDLDVDISLTPASTTLTVGDTQALTAAIVPSNATDKTVKWSISGTNTDAVKLYSDSACTTEVGTAATDKLTVYAKGLSEGSATITVTSNADNTKTDKCEVTVNIAGAVYTATDKEYTITSGEDTPVTVKREPDDSKTYDLYTGAQMDGKALPEGSHTTAKGSLVMTLKAAYLDTLSVGDHKLTIAFEDGSATATIRIKDAEPTPPPAPTAAPTATPKPVPKTGDGSNPALWLGLAVAGLILIAGTVILWNRKKRCGK